MRTVPRQRAGGLEWLRIGGLVGALSAAGCGKGGPDPASGGGTVSAPEPPPALSTQAVGSGSAQAAAGAGSVTATKLVGRWVRPDGGYVLEIRSIDPATGRMDVGYLNPRPIHVGHAEAKEVDGRWTVFVELQDVNYPGSLYRLTYVPPKDQMFGTYYQPALDQSFDVEFVRAR